MSAARTFFVHYSRDDNGMWLAEVFRNPDVGKRVGVASHGRTLQAAETNVREALALFLDVDDEQTLTLLPHYELGGLEEDVAVVGRKREAARLTDADAVEATATTARRLADELELSLRDVAQLLGISFQRVQQILPSQPTQAAAKRSTKTGSAASTKAATSGRYLAKPPAGRRVRAKRPA